LRVESLVHAVHWNLDRWPVLELQRDPVSRAHPHGGDVIGEPDARTLLSRDDLEVIDGAFTSEDPPDTRPPPGTALRGAQRHDRTEHAADGRTEIRAPRHALGKQLFLTAPDVTHVGEEEIE
jgi:hypothetical protein